MATQLESRPAGQKPLYTGPIFDADTHFWETDDAWTAAAKHYDEDQLFALVSLIALINTYNRVNVILRAPGGDYVPGQWDSH